MRHIIRNLFVCAAIALTAPLWLAVYGMAFLTKNDHCFLTCAQTLSLIPGMTGVFLRRGFYIMCLKRGAFDSYIGFGTWFAHREAVIEAGVYIGGRCTMGCVTIGRNALIGSNVDVLSGRHQHYFDDAETPRKEQGGVFTQTQIGENVWIGNSSVVMADIGAHSIIAAGSVVVKPIPACSMAAGNPAVVKKSLGARAGLVQNA
jgi:Acetyltransferase (isoleucine patch superfamily)